jgi:hypothetical protein
MENRADSIGENAIGCAGIQHRSGVGNIVANAALGFGACKARNLNLNDIAIMLWPKTGIATGPTHQVTRPAAAGIDPMEAIIMLTLMTALRKTRRAGMTATGKRAAGPPSPILG